MSGGTAPGHSSGSSGRRAADLLRALPARSLRTLFLWLSRRPTFGRVATRSGITRRMVERFVAGESLADALAALSRLRSSGFGTTVDVLGEAVHSVDACALAADRYLETLDALAAHGLDGNVSLKLTQMGLDVDHDVCVFNLERILERAARTGAFIRVDMEDHTRTDQTLRIVRELRPRYPGCGVVIQAALRRSADDLEQLIREGTRVRLCKGAYNEPGSVAFVAREDVDRSYVRLMQRLLAAGTYPALATHDERLIALAIEFARREGIGAERFEFQMLYGVRRDLQARLVRQGWTVRVYVPFGREWYPYFMRRLAERPANVAFVLRSVLREGRQAR